MTLESLIATASERKQTITPEQAAAAVRPAVVGKVTPPAGLAPGEAELMVREGDLEQYISEGNDYLAPELDHVRAELARIRKDK